MARLQSSASGKHPRSDGDLGSRLRRRRKALDLTAKDLARIAGVSPSYISQLEHGKQDHPSLEVLGALAQALGLPVAELLTGVQVPAVLPAVDVPPVLAALAQELGLDDAAARMLAGINLGGRRPSTREGWLLVYLAVQHACCADATESGGRLVPLELSPPA